MDAVPFWTVTQERLIVEQEPPSRTFVSLVMYIVGFFHAVMAVTLFWVDDVALHFLSALLFLIASGGCFHVAVRIDNIKVVALAGAFTMTAYGSRIAIVIYSWLLGYIETSDARVWLSVLMWGTMTVYAYAIFVRGIAPLSRLYRIHRLAREECR